MKAVSIPKLVLHFHASLKICHSSKFVLQSPPRISSMESNSNQVLKQRRGNFFFLSFEWSVWKKELKIFSVFRPILLLDGKTLVYKQNSFVEYSFIKIWLLQNGARTCKWSFALYLIVWWWWDNSYDFLNKGKIKGIQVSLYKVI